MLFLMRSTWTRRKTLESFVFHFVFCCRFSGSDFCAIFCTIFRTFTPITPFCQFAINGTIYFMFAFFIFYSIIFLAKISSISTFLLNCSYPRFVSKSASSGTCCPTTPRCPLAIYFTYDISCSGFTVHKNTVSVGQKI